MEFCPDCESLLDFPEKEGELIVYCHNCGYNAKSEKTLITQQDYSISNISTENNRKFYVFDPTFPITAKYICPNEKCITRIEPDKKEAIFFNDENSMKIVFICKACHTEWKY